MRRELSRLIAGQIFLHACMAGMRMATPLLALKQGYSAVAVGALLSLFALTQVVLLNLLVAHLFAFGTILDLTSARAPLRTDQPIHRFPERTSP